jgi:transcriptional regulator with XRE-family HTH domain
LTRSTIISKLFIMTSQTGPPTVKPESGTYTSDVAGRAKSSKGPRPKQGAHLLALRKSAGLTQAELADFLGVPQGNIAFWEWSEKPPRSDILPKMAKALGVPIETLLVGLPRAALVKRSGPIGEVQKIFEQVRQLPRSQQRKIVEMVAALVDQYRRKAS